MEYRLNRTGRRIRWTDSQTKYIVDKYVNDFCTIAGIAKEFGCDPDAIERILRDLHIQIRSRREMHPRYSSYFHTIDTGEKAYWLGLLYTDGCVASEKNGKHRVALGMIDREHIQKFLNAIGAVRNKITVVHPSGFMNASDIYYASVYDKEMHGDLIMHGCIPRKTKIIDTVPSMPKEYIFDFVRGYFDGDGCIRYDSNRNCYRMSFVCGSEGFLQSLQIILDVPHLSRSRSGSNGGAFHLDIAARSDLLRIITNMYEHSTEDSRLNRKYEKCQKCLAWLREKEGGIKD